MRCYIPYLDNDLVDHLQFAHNLLYNVNQEVITKFLEQFKENFFYSGVSLKLHQIQFYQFGKRYYEDFLQDI